MAQRFALQTLDEVVLFSIPGWTYLGKNLSKLVPVCMFWDSAPNWISLLWDWEVPSLRVGVVIWNITIIIILFVVFHTIVNQLWCHTGRKKTDWIFRSRRTTIVCSQKHFGCLLYTMNIENIFAPNSYVLLVPF